jgi:hypothetical protein
MILIENKEEISYNKVSNIIYCKEKNVLNSDDNIRYKQKIDIYAVTTSIGLKGRICNEIRR